VDGTRDYNAEQISQAQKANITCVHLYTESIPKMKIITITRNERKKGTIWGMETYRRERRTRQSTGGWT
jgi:succinyl-CoA synthetase alpha subunit